jgi:hypothetical protein
LRPSTLLLLMCSTTKDYSNSASYMTIEVPKSFLDILRLLSCIKLYKAKESFWMKRFNRIYSYW